MIIEILKASRNNQTILLTKTTAAQNEDALSYHRVRGLYFQAVVFVATIVSLRLLSNSNNLNVIINGIMKLVNS